MVRWLAFICLVNKFIIESDTNDFKLAATCSRMPYKLEGHWPEEVLYDLVLAECLTAPAKFEQ